LKFCDDFADVFYLRWKENNRFFHLNEMQALSGIYASSSTDDYAVGENAEVYRLTGSAWEYKGHNRLVGGYSDVNVSSVNIPCIISDSAPVFL
jgi:hypothetical protein